VSEEIIRRGPMSFSEFQDLALYHPQAGFYATVGMAGRSGDFLTSPEVGPLFAQVVGNALDKWWKQLGRPDPFFVFECGAGVGTLADGIMRSKPACLPALRYVAVERSGVLRNEQAGRLLMDDLGAVLSDAGPSRHIGPGRQALVATSAELPKGQYEGVVFANELLDNLPVDIFERRGRHWYECRVGVSKDGGFSEVMTRVEEERPELEQELDSILPNAHDGVRIPLQQAARSWLEEALGSLERGRVVCVDYARTTRWMSRHSWEDWLRTYRNHRPGSAPLDTPGSQDITCEVAIDQLARVRPPDRDRTQAEFLEANGLVELVQEAREAWHTNASTADLGAARARSRVNEGRALTDSKGLGRYRVFEWQVG
jgi:SAM-dependent MidA family methyltransferase